MKQPPFLRMVAQAYASHCRTSELADFCFVFPNKRSGKFFLNYLAETIREPYIEPAVTAIHELTAGWATLDEASRYDQLFVLYDCYSKLSNAPVDFDRFLFWGEMLIRDFNDVDRYMVDAEGLFVNLKRVREISADYLTPEQKELVKRYWGDDALSMHADIDRFWKHIKHDGDEGDESSLRGRFAKLWEVLAPLYRDFTDALRELGMATPGRLSRMAADIAAVAELPYKRYVFVGFNVLNTCEQSLFRHLKSRGVADFYFDTGSPAFGHEFNRAARFVTANAKEFPPMYDLGEADAEAHWPDITVVAVPGNISQAKWIGAELVRMKDDGEIADPDNAIDTAVVLPDETLFLPLLHSIPEGFCDTNVTMGFPLKLTPVAAVIRRMFYLQRNLRNVGGEPAFYRENVAGLAANTVLRSIAPQDADRIERWLGRNSSFTVPASTLRDLAGVLAPVFVPLGVKGDFESTYAYIDGVLDLLVHYTRPNEDDTTTVEHCLVIGYRMALDRLAEAVEMHKPLMTGTTVFNLVERAVCGDSVQLKGEPIHGLQVMGMLETRALDFDNVIIPSMNERTFPRKLINKSFIPEALRKAYGMATIEFQESIFAYYFYRLIGRAERVTLLYDTRTTGSKQSEPSRYVTQLRYMFPETRVRLREPGHTMEATGMPVLSAAKTPEVLAKLERFLDPESGVYLSASALKTYMACPLHFYLQYVEGLREPDEFKPFMDYGVYGSVLHEAAENVYKQLDREARGGLITAEMLRHAASGKSLDRHVVRALNRIYHRRRADELDTPLEGEFRVQAAIMVDTLSMMMRTEADLYAPIELVSTEEKVAGNFPILPGCGVNFKFIIDRMDRARGQLRVVDYKTGSDSASYKEDNPFDNAALFQTVLYAALYSMQSGTTEDIQPILYRLRSVYTDGLKPFSCSGPTRGQRIELTGYKSLMDKFTEEMQDMLGTLFDPEIPFTQTPDVADCKFCHFKELCGDNRVSDESDEDSQD